jgi:hypothetical protein
VPRQRGADHLGKSRRATVWKGFVHRNHTNSAETWWSLRSDGLRLVRAVDMRIFAMVGVHAVSSTRASAQCPLSVPVRFVNHKGRSRQQSRLSLPNAADFGDDPPEWLLSLTGGETSDTAEKEPFGCPPKRNKSPQLAQQPLPSLNWSSPRWPSSIRSLLDTRGGAINTPSTGLSPGIAVSPD